MNKDAVMLLSHCVGPTAKCRRHAKSWRLQQTAFQKHCRGVSPHVTLDRHECENGVRF